MFGATRGIGLSRGFGKNNFYKLKGSCEQLFQKGYTALHYILIRKPVPIYCAAVRPPCSSDGEDRR